MICVYVVFKAKAWWRHQMVTFSALLVLCAGNSPVTGEFPSQRPVARSCDVFFDLCVHKRFSKHSWGWWFETPSSSLWRHRNEIGMAHFWHVNRCIWLCIVYVSLSYGLYIQVTGQMYLWQNNGIVAFTAILLEINLILCVTRLPKLVIHCRVNNCMWLSNVIILLMNFHIYNHNSLLKDTYTNFYTITHITMGVPTTPVSLLHRQIFDITQTKYLFIVVLSMNITTMWLK